VDARGPRIGAVDLDAEQGMQAKAEEFKAQGSQLYQRV